MTPQEAIKLLNQIKRECDRKAEKAYDSHCLYPNSYDQRDYNEYGNRANAIDMAIGALKRNVPVKPIRMISPRRTMFLDFYDWKCPVCNTFLAYEEDGKDLILAHEKSRCSNCFQLIDWSEWDDTTGSD